MVFVPVGEWLPDQPDFQNPGASVILNVFPRTAQSYGPVSSLASAGLGALTARCQGAVGVRDSGGNTYNFAGDATKLYVATSAASSWTDKSKAGGYTIPAEEQWSFSLFNDTLMAHNINDNIQALTITGAGSFADLASAAPKARYSCVSKNFLLVGNTSGGTADSTSPGAKPQRVWWPAIGDPTNWPTLETLSAAAVQSDAQDIVGDFGWITGMVANIGPSDALIFFERAVQRAMYIGAPDVWGFYPINGVRGCPVPGSIQRTEVGTIWLGPDDFYLYDGASLPVGIGNQKVAKTFYSDVDQSYLSRISSALDPINKLYYVAYPSVGTGGGVVDTLLVCNYALQSVVGTPGKWAKITPSSNLEYLFVATSFGYNVDNFTAGTGFNVDNAPAGPDSRLWTGNKDLLAAFDISHILDYFTGDNLAAMVQTSEAEIVKGKRSIVTRSLPIVDGGSPTVTPITRNRLQDSVSTGSTSTLNADGYCPLRCEGRYHRYQLALPSASSYSHIQGIEIPDDAIRPQGTR